MSESTYKELCRDNYSITRVTHRDGRVPRAPRGYSPEWFLSGKLDKRVGIMNDSKRSALPKFQDFKVGDGLLRPKPIKKSNRPIP